VLINSHSLKEFSFKVTIILLFINLFLVNGVLAQPWDFVKEKDGIKIYTRIEPNNSLKSFKGEAIFHAPAEKVCAMLGNAKNTDWWDKGISDIKELAYEENKFVQYYLVYNMPWPLTNRDLVAETRIKTDPVTDDRSFTAKPLADVVPEKSNLVRIRNYRQTWTVQPMDKGDVHVTLEGFIDPGGNIPAWFYNLVIAETPWRAIHSLRERALSAKPAIK